VAKGFVILQRIEPGKGNAGSHRGYAYQTAGAFDPEQFRVRESPSDPVLPFEHDDEHEHD
jgi:hypothetical protein